MHKINTYKGCGIFGDNLHFYDFKLGFANFFILMIENNNSKARLCACQLLTTCCEWLRRKKTQVILYCHILPWLLKAHYKHSYLIHITILRAIFYLIISDLWGMCCCHFHKASHSFLYVFQHATENYRSSINSVLLIGNRDAPNIIKRLDTWTNKGWYLSLFSVIIKRMKYNWKNVQRKVYRRKFDRGW